jgi:hypothetical protein
MFEQVLDLVKEYIGNNTQATAAIPQDQADAVHQEIANHVANGLQSQAAAQGACYLCWKIALRRVTLLLMQ